MMKKYLLGTLCLLITSIGFAQKGQGNVRTENAETVSGLVTINNALNNVTIVTEGNKRTIPFSLISEVNVKNDTYSKTIVNNKTILAKKLVAGKASLLKIEDETFKILKEDGTSKTINTDYDSPAKAQIPGILAVLFNDCNSIRKEIENYRTYSESNLVTLTQSYNNCNYSAYAPTDSEVESAANYQSDLYEFYIGAGASINRISFFAFDDYETLVQPQLIIGIAASPGFLGNLQGNLYTTIEASAAFSSDKDFNNSPFVTNFRKNSYRGVLGIEYRFNKLGAIQPFVGTGIGLASEHYDGNYADTPLDESGGDVFGQFEIGALFAVKNGNKIGFTVSFIPEYETDLSFRRNDVLIPLIIDSHYFNASVSYHF